MFNDPVSRVVMFDDPFSLLDDIALVIGIAGTALFLVWRFDAIDYFKKLVQHRRRLRGRHSTSVKSAKDIYGSRED